MIPQQTTLYRHFDKSHVLLYVGITRNHVTRLHQHMGGSAWAKDIVRVEYTHYPDRVQAMAAEDDAIISERPLWNKVGNKINSREAMQRLVLDIPFTLHHAIKLACTQRGTTMKDEVMALLERRYRQTPPVKE